MNKRSTRFDLQRLLTAKSPGAQALWGLSLLLLILGVVSCLSSRPLILIYPNANPVLATQRHGGLFLTTAQIADREVGPFILDTGASDVVLDAALAETLFPGVARAAVSPPPQVRRGVVTTGRSARFVTTVKVGPLILQDITVALRDLSAASRPFGRPLAGLLGYPFFARVVLEVDYARGTVACFDPRTYRLPSGDWLPLVFQANRPVLPARLEGDLLGHFLLDTGSNQTVLFYPDFVQAHRLQDGRSTEKREAMTVDGPRDHLVTRLAWFEVAGIRFDQPMVFFAPPAAPGPPGLAGIIGAGFLHRFTVIFNYSESKIALLPNEPGR